MKRDTDTVPIYHTAIIGAGAAGLFAGACLAGSGKRTAILEKNAKPGRKLLMAGSGQCNLTHSGSIKEFIGHYGPSGKAVRTVLYRFNNEQTMAFFEERGVPLFAREDGKVFPRSLRGQDVLDALLRTCGGGNTDICAGNAGRSSTAGSCGSGEADFGGGGLAGSCGGVDLFCSAPVRSFAKREDGLFFVVREDGAELLASNVIVTTGGCSYPTTGSDGGFFSVLEALGLSLVPPRPALVPIFTADYPYSELSGISFSPAQVILSGGKNGKKEAELTDDLLFTHRGFSGPAVLNSSRFARPGHTVTVNYLPGRGRQEIDALLKSSVQGTGCQLITLLSGLFPSLPKRFLELLCVRAETAPPQKAAQLSGTQLKALAAFLTEDRHTITGLGGFSNAMVTAGGVALSEVELKTMQSKAIPGLYFAGEVLDVDGDTGGYNLQFAFSSAQLAASSILALTPKRRQASPQALS